MNVNIFIKKSLAYPLAEIEKFRRLLDKEKNNDLLILMYHRIIEKSNAGNYTQAGMYVEPGTFRKQIEYLKYHFNIISLQDTQNVLMEQGYNNTEKPFCVLTFDDGWKDFYINAYPILKNYDACATVFLTTDFIGTTRRFWTDRLVNIIQSIKYDNKSIKNLSASTKIIFNLISNNKWHETILIEKAIEKLKSLPVNRIENILKEIEDAWHIDSNEKFSSFLSWEEIKEMHDSKLVLFGSHTGSHQILTTVDVDTIRGELTSSKKSLTERNVLNPGFIPFAYPNGNYSNKIADIVEEVGYHLALTTRKGWNHRTNNAKELYQLKRIGIHQDITPNISMFACRIYGLY